MTRFGYVMTTYFAVLATGALALVHVSPKLIWNASASAPLGLYAIASADELAAGDLLAVDPPETLAAYLDEHGYLPRGVPLMKHVAALPGQTICRDGDVVTIDGEIVVRAERRDRLGRDLPVWRGCRRIAADELFLLNPHHADSLDGRYFGVLPADTVIGRAIPVFTDADGDGRYAWRGPAHRQTTTHPSDHQ